MCGRYEQLLTLEQLSLRFRALLADELTARELAPTDRALIVVTEPQGRRLALMRWGLVPSWAKDGSIARHTFNARLETLADKPSFRGAFQERRCLVPATAFFEWRGQRGRKTRLRFSLASGEPFAMAGLWERWREGLTFTIVTMPANAAVAPVHERMPAVLASEAEQEAWLARGALAPVPAERFVCAEQAPPGGAPTFL